MRLTPTPLFGRAGAKSLTDGDKLQGRLGDRRFGFARVDRLFESRGKRRDIVKTVTTRSTLQLMGSTAERLLIA